MRDGRLDPSVRDGRLDPSVRDGRLEARERVRRDGSLSHCRPSDEADATFNYFLLPAGGGESGTNRIAAGSVRERERERQAERGCGDCWDGKTVARDRVRECLDFVVLLGTAFVQKDARTRRSSFFCHSENLGSFTNQTPAERIS